MRSPKPTFFSSDAEWFALVEAHARSGLSVPAYARQHGLKPDTLYQRRRRLAASRLVPTAVETSATCEVVFPDRRAHPVLPRDHRVLRWGSSNYGQIGDGWTVNSIVAAGPIFGLP